MLDEFYYESSDKAYRVDIGKDGLYVYSNDIRDYDWSYTQEGSKLTFQKTLGKKKLPLLFAYKNYRECSAKRDEVFYIFERDVKLGEKGRIYINGYYMECFITGSANKGIIRTRFLQTTFDIVTDGVWHKDTMYQFLPVPIVDDSGIDYPYDFPHDLGSSTKTTRTVIYNDCIVDSNFIITIYGGAVDPSIEINGHKYKVNGTVSKKERLVITNVENQKHTIRKYAEDGTYADWFGRRYKDESIFEKIPEGSVPIIWDGTFGFDLTIISSRSEPIWYRDIGDDDVPEESYQNLIDSDGNFIIDSEGNNIEVA